MAAKTPAAVRQQIHSGQADPVYLLMGEDEVEKAALAADFAGLVEEGLRAFNVERIHAGEWTSGDRLSEGVASVIAAAQTLPMMSTRRVVLVMQAKAMLEPKRESAAADAALENLEQFLASPCAETTLVFVSEGLDRRKRMFKQLQKLATIVECGSPEDVAGAERWIRERLAQAGVEIDPRGSRLLAVSAGFPDRRQINGQTGDVKVLRREVDRLLLYAMGQKKISLDDVREVAGPAALQDDWAMANAIEAGQAGEALRQLALMMEAGSPAEQILGQLGWLVRTKFPLIAPASVQDAVDAVFRTDRDLKRSAGEPRVQLERLIVELCGKRPRAGSPRRW